jgi:hypothetical protein
MKAVLRVRFQSPEKDKDSSPEVKMARARTLPARVLSAPEKEEDEEDEEASPGAEAEAVRRVRRESSEEKCPAKDAVGRGDMLSSPLFCLYEWSGLSVLSSPLFFLYASGVFLPIMAQVAVTVWQGGLCTTAGEDGNNPCATAVKRTFILPVQAFLMSTLVYRQTSQASDVLRCLGACAVLGSVELLLDQVHPLVGLPLLAITLYAQVCISLYMYHRFVFHAHWSIRTQGLDRFLWAFLRGQYIQHYFEHHQVAKAEEAVQKLAKLEKVSLTRAELQEKYKGDWLLQNFVDYTDRGITIRHPAGVFGAFLFFFILPSGPLASLSYALGHAITAVLHLLGVVWGMWQTMVNHDKYHADTETLDGYASTSYFGWLWTSAEMKRIIHEHKLHHESGNRNRYFSMMPFDSFFIYPLWPEAHMGPSMLATTEAALNWVRRQAAGAYQGALDAGERQLCRLYLLALLGANVGLAYFSRALFAAWLTLNLLWVYFAYQSWISSMGPRSAKFSRSDRRCYSFKGRPDVVGRTKSLPANLEKSKEKQAGEAEIVPMPAAAPTLLQSRSKSLGAAAQERRAFAETHALNMDHIHVPFLPFLAAYYLLVPNATFLWMSASVKLVLRERLHKAGFLTVKPCDYPRTVAKLCLDGMESINFKGIETAETGEQLAVFLWRNISFIRMDASVGKVGAFKILVDLTSRRMVEATIDGDQVSAKKALTLLWFDTVFGTHVKIHAMANWGIAHQAENLQIKWMQWCTVMYNFFGFTTFTRTITEFWYRVGFTLRCYSNVMKASSSSAASGVPFHGDIRKLCEHSELVDFLTKVRRKFLVEFRRYHADFEGADGEGMFVGTICHSLDHCMMDENLEDPLWLDVDDPEYGAMAELMRHVRVGFVPDLPGLLFNQRYKHLSHPLYQNVYNYAAFVNPWFADRMDAAIVK